MLKKLLKPVNLIIALLIVILVSSFAANLVQNSFFSVKVSKITIDTGRNNGELSGMLYIPRGVDDQHPAPVIITTHGYLNNKEMQEITAIEMSRRGYVVLAIDMYDHGDSTWDTPAQFSFYVYPLYDAVQWMYDQDYVIKDADGNAMIAVSGHSMGGFSAQCAMILDEMDFATNGFRKISVGLPMGSDFRYTPFADPTTYFTTRSVGIVAAHYDQFFFDNSGSAPGSVVYKDFTADAQGLLFLDRTTEGTADAGVFYPVDGGQRVIYTPNETHPQNTWSLEVGKDTFNFFNTAFTYQLASHTGLGSLTSYGVNTTKAGQTWWLKEGFTMIALVALIALIFPVFALLTAQPVFKKIYQNEEAIVPEFKPEKNLDKLIVKGGIILFAFIASTFLVKGFMDRTTLTLDIIAYICLFLIIISVAAIAACWIITAIKQNKGEDVKGIQALTWRVTFYGVAIVAVSFAYRWLLGAAGDILSTGAYYNAPSINTIVYWAMASGGMILLVTLLAAFYFNYNSDDENPLGLKATPMQILMSVVTALVVAAIILFIVAVVGWVFLTDFRFYTYAIEIFNKPQFIAALKYMPLFLVYYFAAGISVFINTKNVKGWLGDLFAALLLAGPVVLFLIIQYRVLYSTGVAFYPTFSLSGILAVGLVPTLSFAAIIMRRFALKTGNVWTGIVFTTVFFTLITLANTTVYLLAS